MSLAKTTPAPRAAPSAGTPPRHDPARRFRYKTTPNRLVFPVEEKVPESPRHMINRMELWLAARDGLTGRGVIASDQFLFFDPTDPQRRLAPDFLIHLGPPGPTPDHWKTWVHGHPDVAVEIISPSDSGDPPWQAKLARYRQVAVKELFRFDWGDEDSLLRAWDWQEDDLVERELDNPRCAESVLLSLYFVVVQHPQYGPWLRLSRDPEGRDLLLIPDERAQKEAERAQKEAERADQAVTALQQALLSLLLARGLHPSAPERAVITSCLDPGQLGLWLSRASAAASVSDLLAPGT